MVRANKRQKNNRLWDKIKKKFQNYTSLLSSNKKHNKNNNKGIVVDVEELIAVRLKSKNILHKPTKKVISYNSGSYRSPFRGRGMEFDELRLYQEGDDIRCIDWRITAKTGVVHTKLFHEERERPVLVLADLRPQMRFATKVAFKSVIAAKIGAMIGWSALENKDRIGGLVISASKSVMLAPHRSRKKLMGFLKALSDASLDSNNKSGVSLSKALSELKTIALTGSMVFVVSDFSDYNEDVAKQLLYLNAHTDVVCIKVYDTLEKTPPPPDVYRISDGKNIAIMRADDKNWRDAYIKFFEEKEQKIRLFCNKYRISFITVRTDDDIYETIYQGLYTQKRKSISVANSAYKKMPKVAL